MSVTQGIIVIDFGSQYTQLIAKKLRKLKYYTEVVPYSKTILSPTTFFDQKQTRFAGIRNVRGIILSGGPASSIDTQTLQWFKRLIELYNHSPIFGICFGHQLIHKFFTRADQDQRSNPRIERSNPRIQKSDQPQNQRSDQPQNQRSDQRQDQRSYQPQDQKSNPRIQRSNPRIERSNPRIEKSDQRFEFGKQTLKLNPQVEQHPIIRGIQHTNYTLPVWMSHFNSIDQPPIDWQVIGSTESDQFSFTSSPNQRFISTQFHPEVDHTPQGLHILNQWAKHIARLQPIWDQTCKITQINQQITQQITDPNTDPKTDQKDPHVLVALSGGVDSAVAATLLIKTLGQEKVYCIYIDTGLQRYGETERVRQIFKPMLGNNLIMKNAAEQFFLHLKNVTDPEQKRKIIGKLFIHEIESTATQLLHITHFAQGTIYSDVIESSKNATGTASNIKSHHNVGGLPQKLKFKLIEPLRNLFKDEVREIGLKLGLPTNIVMRHPFPGPGLAIRVLGKVTPEKVRIAREADRIFMEALQNTQQYNLASQAYAALLDSKCTCVRGDQRGYAHIVMLRAVVTSDFMTAHYKKLDWEFLDSVSRKITNQIKEVGKVVYDITNKPPSTIELE